MDDRTPSSAAAGAFESLAALQQLTLEAGLSDSRQQLIFRIVNRSILYCHYDRAVLWSWTARGPRLLGVSGQAGVTERSPLAAQWRALLTALPAPDHAAVVGSQTFPGPEDAWVPLAERTNGLSVAWLPLKVRGRMVAGLWLERWGQASFNPAMLPRLELLAQAYGVAWRSVTGLPHPWRARVTSRKGTVALTAAVVLLAALVFVRVPLRIVARCEVVPREPVAVTAPLNGVVDEVIVLPGRAVERGDLLAVYDKRIATEEVQIARQQVQIIESELQRARVQAFDDPAARSDIALLANRLEQERVRLQAAQYQVERLEVRAPVPGTLMFDDPSQWRGRPVQVGELLMMVVDPTRTKLRVWLPESDNIEFDRDAPIAVVLDSDPRTRRSASLCFTANCAEVDRDGMPCFRAEAEWSDPGPGLRMGLQGTAVLYGEEVPLGYWLLRRPLATTRRHLGI
ncbi:MAG TPA: HlyD family efflux transporter periplasmic adaptor subunit [Phycisphaerae bacterium]|nr:HlyD family efflux transporter periplasmic adaptor subunit [Phycisphaerae bacterium]HNU46769.1 HlyD family efflux transporter periplasmic adaptor subunit [Phycisphaerae bacterium]